DNGKIYIKDTKSSSGTFLNHIHLSPAGSESTSYQLKDSDIVQLSINYQGGQDDIYKSIKIQVKIRHSLQVEKIKGDKEMLRCQVFTLSETQVCFLPFLCLLNSHCSWLWHHSLTVMILPTTSYLVITAAQTIIPRKTTKGLAVLHHLM
ncbi:hypothetical protein BDR06DRAFT_891674, partial [Suillus hirtellus]